ncbi:MAG TPA: GapR family DNA-binding domain-containing protein [Rhizomicrobium sp.]|jgi:uncharacterized protein (UPF0335 family)
MAIRKPAKNTSSIGNELLGVIERVELLEIKKKEIAEQITEEYEQARSRGFNVKVIKGIVRDRKEDEQTLRERQALDQMYRASIGMLHGTPLGEDARKRLSGEDDKPESDGDEQARGGAPEKKPDALGPEEIAKARDAGAQAARDGKRVFDNPYTANDPRRAAWDEGWCAETGTDGMELPKAWRRKEKKKPDDEDGKGDGKPDGDGAP